jgi:RNA polymerase sigma-70 factor (ECF subfamily)
MAMNPTVLEATRLWTLAQPTVSAFVASIVREFQDRDDVLQDIAVAVMESFDRYDSSRSFVGWSLGIARNQVLLYLRRKGQQRQVFGTAAIESVAKAFENLLPQEGRMLDHLEDCVGMLDADSKRLCTFRYEQDLKPAAIAVRVGMSANTVANTLRSSKTLSSRLTLNVWPRPI